MSTNKIEQCFEGERWEELMTGPFGELIRITVNALLRQLEEPSPWRKIFKVERVI